MRDMIPPGDRSIRNIPIPKGHHRIDREEIPDYYQPEPPPGKPPRPKHKRRPGRFILLALLVILLCGGAVAGISMAYAGATIAVVPRVETITLTASTTLPAQINAPTGTLNYSTVTASHGATTTVPATGTKRVSRQAKGVVTITSTYSANQRLISGTRLEAPDGKIYRLASSVDVPAGGSVSVGINAESPGESYNRGGETTFTLVGFKADPRYTKFSARSQGEIEGGFVGDEPAVATADMETAKAKLKADLDTGLGRKISDAVPSSATAIPGTLETSYGELVQTASTDKKTATISQSATAVGATVVVRDLASALARKTVEGYNGEAVDFKQQGTLSVSVATSSKPQEGRLTLVFGGNTTLVWQFDPNKLKESIMGKDKAQFQTIIESFAPAIASATATIRPFWIKNFPSDPQQIEIEVEETE